MATYKVKPGQNIFDISLLLYGTVEGVFDLLISNPSLSMCDTLNSGDELIYHDTFVINSTVVNYLADNKITPANGERNVYFKQPEGKLRVVAAVPADLYESRFTISGEGVMEVDWGDNSNIERIELSHSPQSINHYFDNNTKSRRIRFYGDFSLMTWDTSLLGGGIYPTMPLTIDEYTSCSNDNSLVGLFLFDGTYKVNLQKCEIMSLASLYDMELAELDLRKCLFQNVGVIDSYLENLWHNNQNRRACKVYLDTEPSETGMAAIEAIISTPEWNTPTQWEFYINDKLYTADGQNAD